MSTKILEKNAEKKAKDVIALPVAQNENPATDEKKAEILQTIEKFKPEPIKTAEGRIEAVKQFDALSNRYKILRQKSNDLKTFKAGNDKMNARIIFENAQGFKLEVQNSSVIEKLTKVAEEELTILTNEAENEVLTFDI